MDKLKPCPFCEGEAELQEIGASPDRYCVKCKSCWAKSVFVDWEEKAQAIKAWNRRDELEAVLLDHKEQMTYYDN